MAASTLTDRKIQTARCDAGRKEIWDALVPGFGVRISAHSKSFFLTYRSPSARGSDGKPIRRRVSLGDYPKTSLVRARSEAAEIHEQIQAGRDPFHVESPPAVVRPSFGGLALDYLERYSKKRKRSWRDDEVMIQKILLPAWGQTGAHDITAKDVRKLLGALSERAPVYANRVHSILRSIFKWGITEWDLDANPARMVARPNPEYPRDRVLLPAEIRPLWQRWAASDQKAAAVLQLRLLTAQRANQILRLRPDQIEVRGDDLWWNVPSSATKTRRPYRVYLAPWARNVLAHVGPHPSGFWFGPEPTLARIEAQLRAHAKRFAQGTEVTNWQSRDLRRTAATLMAERGVSRFIIKRVLGHVDREVTAVYDLYSYDREVKEAVLLLEQAVREIVTEPGG